MSIEIKLLEQMAKKKIRTIQELHEKSGVSREVISRMLNNEGKRKRLDLSSLAKMCEVLECDVGDLVVIGKEEKLVEKMG